MNTKKIPESTARSVGASTRSCIYTYAYANDVPELCAGWVACVAPQPQLN